MVHLGGDSHEELLVLLMDDGGGVADELVNEVALGGMRVVLVHHSRSGR